MAVKRIAMVGVYGGLWREYNPGCFFIGFATHCELKRRLGDAEISLFSFDGRGEYSELQVEEECGQSITFFTKHRQLQLLENGLSAYDAVVMGGDVLWAMNEPVFFVNSAAFRERVRPKLLFNCVHGSQSVDTILSQHDEFRNACSRAAYVSVRTPAMEAALKKIGVERARCVPDPAFALDIGAIGPASSRVRIPRHDKPLLGISVGLFFAHALIEGLRQIDLSKFDVWVYQYSRQNYSHETLLRIKKAYGDRFNYLECYFNPFDTFHLVGNFDISIADTYHGTIAALLQGKSAVAMQIENSATPRLLHLVELVGQEGKLINLAGSGGFTERVGRLVQQIPIRLESPIQLSASRLSVIRSQLAAHFDEMGQIIANA